MAKIATEKFNAPGLPDGMWKADIRVDSKGLFKATVPDHLRGIAGKSEWTAKERSLLIAQMALDSNTFNAEQRTETPVLFVKFSTKGDYHSHVENPKSGTLKLSILWATETRIESQGVVQFKYDTRHTKMHEEYPWPGRFHSNGLYCPHGYVNARPENVLDDTPELRAFFAKADEFWTRLVELLTGLFSSTAALEQAVKAQTLLALPDANQARE